MKNIYIIAITLLFIVVACSDFLDVNTDPNNPSAIDAENLLAAAEGGLSYYLGFEMNRDALLLTQQWSTIYTQYWDVDKYRLLPTAYDNVWQTLYADVLADLNETIRISENKGKTNIVGIAEILKVYTFSIITDTWGDVPYSQALKINETYTPVYDSQESIYTDLIAQIDAAIEKLTATEVESLSSQDVIYNGNTDLWKSFANTLKLRLLMRISDTNIFDAKVVANLMSGDLINANTQNAVFTFGTKDGNFNPLYERFNSSGRSRDLAAAKTLVDILNSTNDPRIAYYFDMNEDTTVYIGNPNGNAAAVVDNAAKIPYSWWEPGSNNAQTRPTLILTCAESYFLQAEAVARGFAPGDAAALYEQGISVSMEKWGVISDDANAFIIANPYVYINSIQLQKWVALYDQGVELYSNWRRVDYPVLPIAANSQNGNQIPVRFPYPYDEISTNEQNVPNIDINKKVWWDKK